MTRHGGSAALTTNANQTQEKCFLLGNQVYQKNKLQEALDYYNQSICLAPHPPPPNAFLMHPVEPHDEGYTHEELALGYANRSAVLFQLKEYELCIRDITRAFDNR